MVVVVGGTKDKDGLVFLHVATEEPTCSSDLHTQKPAHILLKHQDNMTSPSASVTDQTEADCEHKFTYKITLGVLYS